MQCARCEIECAGVEKEEAALSRGNGRELGEADVVADGHGDFAIGWDVDEGDFVAGREDVGFDEFDLAGDVDVEEVDFAVRCEELSIGREEEGGVVVFFRCWDEFGNAAA